MLNSFLSALERKEENVDSYYALNHCSYTVLEIRIQKDFWSGKQDLSLTFWQVA